MLVNNPLELYSVYIGWREYDYIFSALFQVGLTLLPFLMLVFDNITHPFEQPFGDAADTSLRRVSIELFFMALVFIFCVYPYWPLEINDIQYEPHCSNTGVVSTPGNSGTTYDKVFDSVTSSGEAVKMPPAFALVLGIASGLTNGLIEWSIPCETNVMTMMNQLSLTHLSNDLSEQVKRFNVECYQLANNQFQTQKPEISTYQSVMDENGGESDLQWLGSHVYQSLYYSDMLPDKPVPGFPYGQYPSEYVDDAVTKGEMATPVDGYPTCQQWWADSTYGLKQRIVNEVDEQSSKSAYLGDISSPNMAHDYLENANLIWQSNLSDEDFISRQALYWSTNADGVRSVKNHTMDANQGVIGSLSGLFMDLGQWNKRYWKTPGERAAISEIFPVMQAMLYLFIVMFMPFVLVLGRYRFRIFFTLAVMLFSVVFCNFIWEMLQWFESAMLTSLSNPTVPGARYFQNSYLTSVFTVLYVISPLLFLSLMSVAGYQVGGVMERSITGGRSAAAGAVQDAMTPSKVAGMAGKIAGTMGKVIK